ncbi:MAG: DEAD/DEAH box helicase [Acidimicrobiia bacterium]|nr:DEAD/DEAH box helicase [Acidimicrobiia bacterium]
MDAAEVGTSPSASEDDTDDSGDAGRGFRLDRFQVEAIASLDAGRSVLVAAPTGAGKTVVAEHAVAWGLANGTKVFYTTPIKALSNQKFRELTARHGSDSVGLLTGDNAINPDAPVVVMTTEVLRNMIYARSPLLATVSHVVLDEVHYLQDAYRGPTWEEVIVHLPRQVRLVCLSATVSNAGELVEWLTTVRGPTDLVTEHRRPVELVNLYAVEDRASGQVTTVPVLVDGRPNQRGARFDRTEGGPPGKRRSRRRYATPDRLEIVHLLDRAALLPAIVFIFSRAACDDAVRQVVHSGLRFTDADERAAIVEIAERHVEDLADEDLAVLGYDDWLASLQAGVAAHHAGMVPPFKEAVESCFAAGFIRVVYATETLALGVNMPARTVVLEKLTKFTGEHHEFLTPGQFTQITGRAGRRGLDDIGHAVVLWSPFVSFGEVAELAASRSFPLRSSFRPTYNMAANLVRSYRPERAHELLRLSFGQFQTDRRVVQLGTRVARRREEIDALEAEASCSRGDAEEYLDLLEAARRRAVRERRRDAEAVHAAMAGLRPGEVVRVRGEPAAVLSVSHRKGGAVHVRAVTGRRRVVRLVEADVDEPPTVLGTVTTPTPYAPRDTTFQRELARQVTARRWPTRGRPARRGGSKSEAASPTVLDGEETDPADHPVDDCPDRSEHLRALRRLRALRAEQAAAEERMSTQTDSLGRRFDAVLDLLEAWGYVAEWTLTSRGERLLRIFHECDLLVAEALEGGLFDGLTPAEVAGLASCVVYEHRSSAPAPDPWFPPGALAERWDQLESLAAVLQTEERRRGLELTRQPDPGFVAVAHAWAAGGHLDTVLEDEEITGGDFVRTTKVLLDVLRQLGDAAGDPATAAAARQAAEDVFRGVVAASSAVGAGVADDDEDPLDSNAGSSAP